MTRRHDIGLAKAPTGIHGLDDATTGGLPRGRTALVLGGPGSGKTVLALQTLVHGARHQGEPAIFVAFEESAQRITANAATFGWDLPDLQRKKLFFLDAQLGPELILGGVFDLSGMLATLDLKVRSMRAKRIVFDSVDILLSLLPDPMDQRREIYRLHEWLLSRGLTALITAKTDGDQRATGVFNHLQFMVDCAVAMNHRVIQGVAHRSLRVLKYRGSAFAENELPLVIGRTGIEVASDRSLISIAKVTSEHLSTGVPRLDTMLSGGYFRGANILISGAPGTAKSTLGGAFAEAACARGDRTLFVSFESDPQEIVRNLTSVGIRLGRFQRRGVLRMELARMTASNAEIHLVNIKAMVRQHAARCLVIDPISAVVTPGNEGTASGAVQRMLDWSKAEGLTTLFTSLLVHPNPQTEGTPLQISTIADTWLHVSNVEHAGERNRALNIIKSRGTSHSNQVRELILSDRGVSLADVYTSDGRVLMGTMRWERERAERADQVHVQSDLTRKRVEIAVARGDLVDRVRNLQRELKLKQVELDLLEQAERGRQQALAKGDRKLRHLRRADSKPDLRGTAKIKRAI